MPKSIKNKRAYGAKLRYTNDRARPSLVVVVRDNDRNNIDILTIILTFGFMMWILLCILILTKNK